MQQLPTFPFQGFRNDNFLFKREIPTLYLIVRTILAFSDFSSLIIFSFQGKKDEKTGKTDGNDIEDCLNSIVTNNPGEQEK
jgi:hypothetical protein